MRTEHYTSWDHIAAADVADLYGDQIFAARPKWSGSVSSMTTGWAGGQAIVAPNALRYDAAVSFEAGIVRVRFKPTALTNERIVIRIALGATVQFDLKLTTGGFLKVAGGPGATVDVTSTNHTALVVGTWYSIELGFYLHNTLGTVRVRLDGVDIPDLALNNVDNTTETTQGFFGRVQLDNVDGHFDDFLLRTGTQFNLDRDMISDNLGNPKIATLFPSGLGTYEQWNIGAGVGAHWEQLDEQTGDSTTTYLTRPNSGTYLGTRESWHLQDIVPVGSISTPLPNSNPVVPNHPGVFASDEWEDYFTVKPPQTRGFYVYDDDTAIDRVSLLSAGRLQFSFTNVGKTGPRRTEVARWDPTKSAQIFLEEPLGQSRFYSFGFEIPPNWVQSEHKTVIFQWHDASGANPVLSMEVVGNEFRLISVVNSRIRLWTFKSVIGKTHRFTFQIVWRNNTTGMIRMWYNEQQIFTRTNFATTPNPSTGPRIKFGLYLPGIPNGVYNIGFSRTIIYNYFLIGKSLTSSDGSVPPPPAPISDPNPPSPTDENVVLSGILDVSTVFQVRHSTNTVRCSHFWRMGGADFDSLEDDPPGGSNVWAYQTKRWPVSPYSGQPWSSYELNNAEAGIRRSTTDIFGAIEISQGCVVVLFNDAAAPATVTRGTSVLIQKSHHLASAWKIQRTDGQTFYFTDHNGALVLDDGNTYAPAPCLQNLQGASWEASARRKEAYLREPNFEVRGALTSDAITVADLQAGRFRDAKVTEYLVDWRVPWAGSLHTFIYWIGEATYDGSKYLLEMTGTANRLVQKVGEIYTQNCRYRLGDKRCKVPLAQLTRFGIAVESVQEEHRVFRVTGISFEGGSPSPPDDYFNYGVVTFVSGANKDLTFQIKDWVNATKEFTLQLETPEPIAVGDRFNVEPGCNLLMLGDCLNKYQNVINFGGHPYVTGLDRALQTRRRF